ncbi:MAG: hypothetical protein GY859_27540 [Desulfobacterales bacterium]|nr:hypothetical protein [Desulfobacterales bacterium]
MADGKKEASPGSFSPGQNQAWNWMPGTPGTPGMYGMNFFQGVTPPTGEAADPGPQNPGPWQSGAHPWMNAGAPPPGPAPSSPGGAIEQDGAFTDPSPLVALNTPGAGPPFFCAAPLMGSVAVYKELAEIMRGDRQVYGMQPRGLDGADAPSRTIEEMARLHIDNIRSVQPGGPYALGGYASGGWVAFEIARQLAALGEEVRPLAIFGTGPPPTLANPALCTWIDFYAKMAEDYHDLFTTSFLTEEQRGARKDEPPPPPAPGPPPALQVAAANNIAVLRYLPRPFAGSIHLFISEDLLAGAGADPTLGWRVLGEDAVETHTISGVWSTMFQRPNLRVLADKAAACLNRAQKET